MIAAMEIDSHWRTRTIGEAQSKNPGQLGMHAKLNVGYTKDVFALRSSLQCVNYFTHKT